MMRINLLPREERGRSTQRTSGVRIASIGLVALVIVVTLGTGFHLITVNILRQQEAELREQVVQVRAEQSRLNAVRRENDDIQVDVDRLEQVMHQATNEETGRLLRDIGASVPPDAWLERLSIHGGNDVFAAGHAGETGDLSLLLRELQRASGVENVHLATMERTSGPDGYRREFTVNLTVEGWDD